MDAGDTRSLRTIVTDGDPLVRRLVRTTLERARVTVIAEATTGREAVELALHYRPEIVLMGYMMPGMDGVEAMRRIVAGDPAIRVVIFTSAVDDELALTALREGAAGFLTKDLDLAALPRALRGVMDGEAAISRRLAMVLVERARRAPEAGEGLRPVRSVLTAREWEVLDLMAAGTSTDAIAERLVLSDETVRTHVKHIYRKLGVRCRDDAVRAAGTLRESCRIAA